MFDYLMENTEEDIRLELKTDPDAVKRQAASGGILPGMKVLDVGCGIGKTTAALAELVGPDGCVVGIDGSPERLRIANEKYSKGNIRFERRDFKQSFGWHEEFDAVWVRFVLEYFRKDSMEVLANILPGLKPGGRLVLADLDQNCLLHYGASERLMTTLKDIMSRLTQGFNFDPYAGGHLPGYLYDLGFSDIRISIEPHHLIFGEIDPVNDHNWTRKVQLTAVQSGCDFSAYAGEEFAAFSNRYEAFLQEFREFFRSPRRFTYTPLVIASGTKVPAE